MRVFSYNTLQSPVEGSYKEKGSKFLSFAYPVSSEIEIKEKITGLKKLYFDARHHCFAWRLGADKKNFRSFDDGEPNHSAGDPILGKIRSTGITDVLIVVVRYFGGVKLGVGGLINAYRAAAEDALNKSVIVEKYITEALSVSFNYEITSDIMRVVKEFELKIIQQDFDNNGNIKLLVPLQQKDQVLAKLEFIKAIGKEVSWQTET